MFFSGHDCEMKYHLCHTIRNISRSLNSQKELKQRQTHVQILTVTVRNNTLVFQRWTLTTACKHSSWKRFALAVNEAKREAAQRLCVDERLKKESALVWIKLMQPYGEEQREWRANLKQTGWIQLHFPHK